MNEQEKEYPLYPQLSEDGNKQAQELMDKFKEGAKKAIDDLLDEYMANFYCDILPEIESDSWLNYRNTIMNGFRNYNNRNKQNRWDFKTIRQEIYKEFRDEIIVDLNQDNLDKIKELEERIQRMTEREAQRFS